MKQLSTGLSNYEIYINLFFESENQNLSVNASLFDYKLNSCFIAPTYLHVIYRYISFIYLPPDFTIALTYSGWFAWSVGPIQLKKKWNPLGNFANISINHWIPSFPIVSRLCSVNWENGCCKPKYDILTIHLQIIKIIFTKYPSSLRKRIICTLSNAKMSIYGIKWDFRFITQDRNVWNSANCSFSDSLRLDFLKKIKATLN